MASSWYILALLFAAVTITQCNLRDFAKMIKDVTGRSAFDYAFYGCYCGLGGSGKPKDKTDWCCHKHDCCYDHLVKIGCKPKETCYKFKVVDGKITCDDPVDKCPGKICECDREAVLCFKANLGTFANGLKNYDKRAKCNETGPDCSMYKFLK